jgi:hypothetical protein
MTALPGRTPASAARPGMTTSTRTATATRSARAAVARRTARTIDAASTDDAPGPSGPPRALTFSAAPCCRSVDWTVGRILAASVSAA